MFKWNVGGHSPIGYKSVNINEGGMWNTTTIGGPDWGIFCVHVSDLKQSTVKAEELGGKAHVPFTDNGKIKFGCIENSHSNRFGIW
jgi:hypothetical protein